MRASSSSGVRTSASGSSSAKSSRTPGSRSLTHIIPAMPVRQQDRCRHGLDPGPAYDADRNPLRIQDMTTEPRHNPRSRPGARHSPESPPAPLALGIAELLAGLLPGAASPIIAVGDLVIALQPPGAKQFVVDLFGTADKLVLNLLHRRGGRRRSPRDRRCPGADADLGLCRSAPAHSASWRSARVCATRSQSRSPP